MAAAAAFPGRVDRSAEEQVRVGIAGVCVGVCVCGWVGGCVCVCGRVSYVCVCRVYCVCCVCACTMGVCVCVFIVCVVCVCTVCVCV